MLVGFFEMLGDFSFFRYLGRVENYLNVPLPHENVVEWLTDKKAGLFFIKCSLWEGTRSWWR